MILDGFSAAAIARAATVIGAGELLGLPTETVYGLAADADNVAAVARIYQAKGRPPAHPLIVHVLNAASVTHYAAEVPDFARALMQAFWPGPLTLILPRRPEVAAAAAGGQNSIGLRCPSHPVAQALLQVCRTLTPPVWGVAAPSANQFGRVSPTTARHVQGEFEADLLILDGGPCAVGIESTIIDCTRGVPVLLRPGAISRAQAQAASGQTVFLKEELTAQALSAPRVSGTLESHYAPRARVRLMDGPALQLALAGLNPADTAPGIALYTRSERPPKVRQCLHQRMPDDAVSAARELFAVLRALDAPGVKVIWIEAPPEHPDWDGVRDRLQRAAA